MRVILKNEKGVSLVSTVIAMGLLGVITLGVMNVSRQGNKINKGMRETLDRNSILKRLHVLLLNSRACENTFNGINVYNSSGVVIPVLKDSRDQDVFTAGQKVGQLTVNSMRAYPIGAAGSYSATSFRFQFSLDGSGKGYSSKSITQNIVVQGALDATGQVLSCHTMDNEIVEQSVIQACNGLGAFYDDITKSCVISSIGEVPACPQGQAIREITYDENSNMYTANCTVVFDTNECIDSTTGERGYIVGFINGSPKCEYPSKHLDISSFVDAGSIDPTSCSEMSLAVINNKIKLRCVPPPPSCTGCAQWGPWEHYATGSHDAYCGNRFKQGVRTKCAYKKICVQKSPLGCVGSVSPQTSGYKVFYESNGGNKYYCTDKGRNKAKSAYCPLPSTFGL
jgi:hypothetical protein